MEPGLRERPRACGCSATSAPGERSGFPTSMHDTVSGAAAGRSLRVMSLLASFHRTPDQRLSRRVPAAVRKKLPRSPRSVGDHRAAREVATTRARRARARCGCASPPGRRGCCGHRSWRKVTRSSNRRARVGPGKWSSRGGLRGDQPLRTRNESGASRASAGHGGDDAVQRAGEHRAERSAHDLAGARRCSEPVESQGAARADRRARRRSVHELRARCASPCRALRPPPTA